MAAEPSVKRTVAFFDGRNLFHAARKAFGIRHPDFDPVALAMAVCTPRGWALQHVRFKIVSAFPTSPTVRNRRGVYGSDWIPVDRQTYETCRDPRDYRPKTP